MPIPWNRLGENVTPNRPVVGMSAGPSGNGYWLVGADGGIFSFGRCPLLREPRRRLLSQPVVAMAVSPSGAGYWLVKADNTTRSFGNAPVA